MNIKLKSIAFIAFLSATSLFAQNRQFPWAVSLDMNYKEYTGEFGKSYFAFKHFNIQPGIGVSRYLTPWVDLGLNLNYGSFRADNNHPVVLPSELSYTGLFSSMNARLKINNGKWLKEDARIAPFLTAGIGYHLGKKYVPDAFINNSRVSNALFIPLGAGAKININERWGVILQSTFMPSVTDKLDGLVTGTKDDKWMEHKVGITYQFGACKSKKNVAVNDQDGDGVADQVDRCPNTKKGTKVDSYGCEIVDANANDEISTIVKGIYFATGSANLREDSYSKLDQLVVIMNKFKMAKLIIEGHTDNTGDNQKNIDLSQKRADAVKAYLVTKGIAPDRITSRGYGSAMSVESNDTEAGRALNRRVEIILTK